MDKNLEEFQSMGIFKIYVEAYKVTLSWKKIFSQIALALILPLAIISLAQIEITDLLKKNIEFNLNTALRAICGLFLVILSLLSTSAVVYTIACIYSSKEITFKKVMTAVPKVLKRLTVTFLWNFLIVFLYNLIVVVIIFLLAIVYLVLARIFSVQLDWSSPITILVTVIIVLIPYMIGAIYIGLVWYLASVVSILEDIRGIEAMKKGKALVKGKIWISLITAIPLQICNMVNLFAFSSLVVQGESLGMAGRVSLGIFCLVLLVIFVHFGRVIQTIIYFVCKSYHKENIDKSSLVCHLDGYHLGDYESLSRGEVDNPV
ncbi:hypothetical protein MKW98_014301 [Papaver atlanticum]|uniref:Uncharacterized protein n=1 Tax=Papaver atlanticum TaxID=357466 RepID=A0AAD4XNJ2_9MAGN|nr:hypothetical protein MKW98_014301 [Papaver atlanticum]